MEAFPHGITGAEAITRLIPLLPPEWQDWATYLEPRYVDETWIGGVVYGDLRGFVAAISYRYLAFDDPPPPPYGAYDEVPDLGGRGSVPPLPDDPFPVIPLSPHMPFVPEPFMSEALSPVTEFDLYSFLALIPTPDSDLPPGELTPVAAPLPLPPSDILPSSPLVVPQIEDVLFDPYPRVAPFPEPGTLEFQLYMHPILYPPSRDAQEGGSRPAQLDSDEEDPDEETPEMTVGYGRTQPLQRRTATDGADMWVPVPEVPVN